MTLSPLDRHLLRLCSVRTTGETALNAFRSLRGAVGSVPDALERLLALRDAGLVSEREGRFAVTDLGSAEVPGDVVPASRFRMNDWSLGR